MHPIICQIGPLHIYSFGVMIALAAIVCTFWASRDGKRMGISADVIYDFAFCLVVSGLVGARLFFVALNLKYFLAHPLEIVMIQNGGLAWQGGLIVGFLSGVWFLKKKKLPILSFADLAAPYLALGQAIGRIGCFLNGCCYGKPFEHGIYFPVHEAKLYPTQLYEAFALVIIFLVLKFYRTRSKLGGEILVTYFILASAARFGVEFYRADHTVLWMGLSIFQIVCLFIFVSALYARKFLPSKEER